MPWIIRNTIIKSCRESAVNIGNRKKAIKSAIDELGSNEVLLIAGKGHEKTQDYGNKIINFSDKKTVKEIIYKTEFYYEKKHHQNFLFKNAFYNNLKNIK